MRARELGIVIGPGAPGRWNAITDVIGVRVGHTTLIEGEGPLRLGQGPVRTGGTGMICHGFKGGIGTASRLVAGPEGEMVVGVLVQANYGRRERFRVNGLPVGEVLDASVIPLPGPASESQFKKGSIIVIVATDAPLLPHQCRRLAQRAGLGVARMGGVGEHSSGDLFLAFSTGNRALERGNEDTSLSMRANERLTPLFEAVVDATEEAILNAL